MQEYVAEFQERRAKVDEDVVKTFMSVRPLEWNGNPKIPRADLVVPVTKGGAAGADGETGDGKLTKNQLKKLLKEQEIARKKAEKQKEKEAKTAGPADGTPTTAEA